MLYLIDYQVFISIFINIHYPELRLVAIAKKKFMIKQSLYEILQIISISIFEKMPINQLFKQNQLQYENAAR